MAPSQQQRRRLRKLRDRYVPVRRALLAALIYVTVGGLWIAFSDRLVETWFPDPTMLSLVQTWKGLLFIIATGVVLFLAMRAQFERDRRLLALQHHQRQALRKRERQLSVLMDNLPGMAYRCRFDRDRTLLFVSGGCARLTGYDPEELSYNGSVRYTDLIPDQARVDEVVQTIQRALENRQPYSLEYPLVRKDGQRIWVWERGQGVEDDDGELVLEGIVLDISGRKALESRLEEQATRDALTGLYNRREATRLLNEELARARRYRRSMALLWVDFDHFKDINDTHGHAAGDMVLKAVGRLLMDSVRGVDTVGRFGGEEFVIVLPEMDALGARDTAERLRQAVSQTPQTLDDGTRVSLTISVGVAVYPEHGQDAETLCAAADKAMYRAKERGRNCVVVASAG